MSQAGSAPNLPSPAYPTVNYSSPQQRMPDFIEWILASPSIPIELRDEFYVLWETAPLGVYQGNDIEVLMALFDEWRIHVIQSIPDKQWGKILVFRDTPEGRKQINMDINVLMSTLKQMYFIQLTRGRDGETLKALKSQWVHQDVTSEVIEQKKKKGFRLF